MPTQLNQYLSEHYDDGRSNFLHRDGSKGALVQVDDRDDNDSFTDFCDIFCTVTSPQGVRLELSGKFPITDEMAAFAAARDGFADRRRGRLVFSVSLGRAEAIDELAQMVKGTARMGSVAGNPEWFRISARTVSSLLRFSRVLREYAEMYIAASVGKLKR